jgi:1,2-dihydroxy-3-keto-5-methylthiopentene dioxygenase
MAIVRTNEPRQEWRDAEAIASLLQEHGVIYEQWDISRLASQPRREGESDQEHILRVFAPEVQAVSEARGYRSADVISLRPDTPNLDALLQKFDREHIHTEDEVRFVVNGRGIFTIRGADERLYDVEVLPGDLLVVPESTKHWFALCEDRQIQCIRLFTDTAGWVAHYVEAPAES